MWSRAALFALCAALGACQPSIGDECQTSADCSQGGERLCDITQPGGYCTVFGCEPGSCPEDSTCVAFGAELSTLDGCEDRSGLSRFARAFCMAECDSSDDCRGGYRCLRVGEPDNVWGAVVIDQGDSGKVCIVPPDPDAPPLPERPTEYCSADLAEGGSTSSGTGGSSQGTGGTESGGTSGGTESGGMSGDTGGGGGSSGDPGSAGSSGDPGGGGSSGDPGGGGSSGDPGSAGSSGDPGSAGSSGDEG